MRVSTETLRTLGLKQPSKYGNEVCECLSRHRHDSKAEADYCNSLLVDKRNGKIKAYGRQIPFVLVAGIVHRVDFVVINNDDTIEIHEVKGHPTKDWKLKYKMCVDKYPDIKYVIINRRKDNGRRNSPVGEPGRRRSKARA